MEGNTMALNVRFGETLTDGYRLFDPASFDKTARVDPNGPVVTEDRTVGREWTHHGSPIGC